MIQGKQNYDLEERTASFGETIIKFCRELPKSYLTQPLLVQLIRCGTSIGANYCEADNAESRKDFTHKIGICKKEAKETMHFLRMIVAAVPEATSQAKVLWQEAKELNLIFNKIFRSSKNL
jgi:four helix bundle protein